MTRDEAAEIIARHGGHPHIADVAKSRPLRNAVYYFAQKNTAPGSPERDAVDEAWTWFQAHDTALREELGES